MVFHIVVYLFGCFFGKADAYLLFNAGKCFSLPRNYFLPILHIGFPNYIVPAYFVHTKEMAECVSVQYVLCRAGSSLSLLFLASYGRFIFKKYKKYNPGRRDAWDKNVAERFKTLFWRCR